jgi:hypothetical protein
MKPEGSLHLVASHDTQGDAEDLFLLGSSREVALWEKKRNRKTGPLIKIISQN